MNLQRRVAGRGERTFGASGAESNFRKAGALDYRLVHLAVAPVIAGFAAGGVEDDLATGLAGCGIVANRAAFKRERAFDGVKVAGQSNAGATSGGIWLQLKFVRRRLSTEQLRHQNNDDEQGSGMSFLHESRLDFASQALRMCVPSALPFAA